LFEIDVEAAPDTDRRRRRHRVAIGAAGNDGVPENSHLFLGVVGAPPAYSRVARGALDQIATFFESDGKTVISPTPAELWEMPIKKLPDDTFFMPRPR
jgi:hypothetical protein